MANGRIHVSMNGGIFVKKERPVHILPMLLCMAMLCSIPAYAVEARASARISYNAVSLSKKSDGNLSIYFFVRATDVMEKIGASSVAIQRSSGSDWVTEYTFTTSNTPTLQGENRNQYLPTWHHY